MFSCEFCEISNNSFFTEHFRTTASKKTYTLYVWFTYLHQQYSDFYFLIFLLKELTFVKVFISRRTTFQIWGPRYGILAIPWKRLWILSKAIQMDFASGKYYFAFPKSHLLLVQTSFLLLQTLFRGGSR